MLPPKRDLPDGFSPPRNGSKRPCISPPPPASTSDEPDKFEIVENPRSGKGPVKNQAGATDALPTAPASVQTMSPSHGGGGIASGLASGQLNQECPCGAGSCVVLQSATFVGRQYYRCPTQDNGGCNFFLWCDKPQDLAINLVVTPCPCPVQIQRLPKDQLFDFFLGKLELQICTSFTRRIEDQPMLRAYTVPGAKEIKHSSYTRGSPLAQGVVQSMVAYLSNLQRSGWSLNGNFVLADFYLTPLGKCMMSTEKISTLVKASDGANKNDFVQVHNIIKTDLFITEEQLPIDFKIFLSLLSEFEEKNRDLIVNSLALVPQARQLEAHSKFFKKLLALQKTDPKKHSKILLELPYIDPTVIEGDDMHWKLRAERNNYLSYHLAYTSAMDRKKLKRAERKAAEKKAAETESMADQLPDDDKAGGNILGDIVKTVDDHDNEEPLVAPKLGPTYPDGGQGQVKLIRNCDEHLHPEHGLLSVIPGKLAVSFEKPGAIDARAELSADSAPPEWVELFSHEEVGYILDQAFPGAIVRLQKAMHEANVLNKAL